MDAKVFKYFDSLEYKLNLLRTLLPTHLPFIYKGNKTQIISDNNTTKKYRVYVVGEIEHYGRTRHCSWSDPDCCSCAAYRA
jgi:hypothetical protein